MISPEYFVNRWSWYRPILYQGEHPADRCAIDTRRLPLRIPGKDAKEYIPFAVHSEIRKTFHTSFRKLQDYTIRYLINKERVSAHKLPGMNAETRKMFQHLRQQNPHLPSILLHHWCADPMGAEAIVGIWRGIWFQGWRQDHADVAPWVPAVNVLLLRLIRESIASLTDDDQFIVDHVMLSVIGGLYVWALQRFLKEYLEGEVEVTRIASYEAMMMPVTPMVFVRHQPEDALLWDDRRMIRAYGLEPDLVPRMHQLRAKLGVKNEGGLLKLLARDRQGNHMLRRSWARLSIWEIAILTGDGAWMSWVLNAKELDRLLNHPEQLDEDQQNTLKSYRDLPFSGWLLAQIKGGRAAKGSGEPWVYDERTLNAFRVFEEDVRMEIARRRSERLWEDRTRALVGPARGADADKILEKAWEDAQLVFIQPDANLALHAGSSLVSRQACLRICWSDYLAGMSSLYGRAMENFLEQHFLPTVLAALENRRDIFLDEMSASGCLLRGAAGDLFLCGQEMRQRLRQLHQEASGSSEASIPSLPMCLSMIGEWISGEIEHPRFGHHRLNFALAVAQADAGISRDCGVGRLIAYRDHKAGRKPLGGVRVESVDTGVGQHVQVLYNNGFAMTAAAVNELVSVLQKRFSIRDYHVDYAQARIGLSAFRLPAGEMKVYEISDPRDQLMPSLLLVRVGEACVAGVDMEMYQMLDPDSEAARAVMHALPEWR